MATIKEAAELTSELNDLAEQLHSELTEGEVDFSRMIELADEIRQQAEGLSETFTTVNEALMKQLTDARSSNADRGAES